jgi:hypothetical protein
MRLSNEQQHFEPWEEHLYANPGVQLMYSVNDTICSEGLVCRIKSLVAIHDGLVTPTTALLFCSATITKLKCLSQETPTF